MSSLPAGPWLCLPTPSPQSLLFRGTQTACDRTPEEYEDKEQEVQHQVRNGLCPSVPSWGPSATRVVSSQLPCLCYPGQGGQCWPHAWLLQIPLCCYPVNSQYNSDINTAPKTQSCPELVVTSRTCKLLIHTVPSFRGCGIKRSRWGSHGYYCCPPSTSEAGWVPGLHLPIYFSADSVCFCGSVAQLM